MVTLDTKAAFLAICLSPNWKEFLEGSLFRFFGIQEVPI
jgi:hypothetical protein